MQPDDGQYTGPKHVVGQWLTSSAVYMYFISTI